ncbi:MAG: MFS transporter [Acidobacteria bacterium]|nr:MFS transporter [Acidobacteriota bacterium]
MTMGEADRADGTAGKQARRQMKPVWWVGSTYFIEGLPYMIVRALSSVYFTDIGVKERYIGYLNFLGIPWNFKWAWAPLVDLFFTKRAWLVAVQFLLALATFALAGLNLLIPPAGDPAPYLLVASGLFIAMGFLAATNDIAIDAYYLEGLTDKKEQAAWSGHRILTWRLSVPYVRSLLVAVAAWAAAANAGAGPYAPWFWAFGAGGLTLLVFAVFHLFCIPRFETVRTGDRPSCRQAVSRFGEAFLTFLRQERIALALVFIILYKIGDEIIFCMVTPFLMREIGLSKAQFSWISGIVGTVGIVAGSMLGAWIIKQWGLKRTIWPLTLLMNLNIWAYIWLAWTKPSPADSWGVFLIALIHGYENLANGLGNAVLIIYVMRLCKPEYKATHFAVGSAIWSLASVLFGGFGGRMVESMGYVNFYILGFFATIPSMVLLFWIPLREEEARAS